MIYTWMLLAYFLAGPMNEISGLQQEPVDLIVEVHNIKEPGGQILLALYDASMEFLGDKILREAIVVVGEEETVKIHIQDIPPGTYAISLYHDRNSNHKLDTKIFGIPKEPYGFSNNARKPFRAPHFDEAAFELKKNGQIERIRVK